MALSVAPVSNTTLDQSAPVQQPTINGVSTATPGSNGFAGLPQPAPAAPASTPPATGGITAGGSTGTSTATPISQQTIDAIMASIAGGIANNQTAFDNAKTLNAGADANAEGDYHNQVQSNTGSRVTAIQNADQAAAQGNQGLRAVLASLGALNGTGQVLAGRAVANSANSDIGSADTTYTANNQAIEQAHKELQNSQAARDTALQTALDTDNKSDQAKGIQNLLNDAQTSGDVATYNKFLPQLVAADVAPTQAIAAAPLVYANAPTSAYAPNSSQNITAAPSQGAAAASTTPVNSALYAHKTS